jgi:hypothetical protein
MAFVQQALEPLCAKAGVVAGKVFVDRRTRVEGKKTTLPDLLAIGDIDAEKGSMEETKAPV